MNEKIVLINTSKGVDHVIKILENVAKVKGMMDVYKEMMAHITTMHNVRPWGEIQKYAEKLGCYIYDGDLPNKRDNHSIIVTGITAKGKIMRRILDLDDSLLEDERMYHFDGNYIYPIGD